MADEKYRRRRRKVGDYGQHSGMRNREEISPSPSPRKPPITILGLAKPSRVSSPTSAAESDNSAAGGEAKQAESMHDVHREGTAAAGGHDKPSVLLLSDNRTRQLQTKPGDGDYAEASAQGSHTNLYTGDDGSPSASNVKRAAPGSMISSVIDQNAQMQSKLAPPMEKQGKIKLVDDTFQWCDKGLDLMLEQSDFLVVGAVGLQGCGKSTLLSLLAGNTQHDAYRNYLFFPQTKETKEDCLFQTSGIDMFVTSDRVILLDTEPLLSISLMDCFMRYEKKPPPEYNNLQNFIEMQSMQLLTFLLSVCNIVLIADDWFVDMSLLRLVQDAEMLKPSTQPSSSSAENMAKDYDMDLYPTVIFVHNKASRDDFTPRSYFAMQKVLHQVFSNSKLKIRSGINMTNEYGNEPIIHRMPGSENDPAANVNLLLIPTMEFYKSEPEFLESSLPEYRGYPSFNSLLSYYRAQILSAPRSPITHSTLSEKNWYHFSARMWESVRKSPLLAEYNRLLSTTS
ncbi:protein smg9-like [Plakobranchus ocellatus]|uniref:Protein smg9-like n=1 Tax=Plakobranchus ocellatus TaxID=259542 RepID=A0AAV3XMX7_9GAST|nr:protein smg9-like [Plakobranchus ocellatus]